MTYSSNSSNKLLQIFIVGILFFLPVSLFSITDTLKIVVAGSPPFVIDTVIKGEKTITGISIDIWKSMAKELNIQYTLTRGKTVGGSIDSIQSGVYDLLVGPITVNATRAEKVNFMQPYSRGKMGIMTNVEESSFLDFIAPLFSKTFAIGIGILLSLLFVVGNLIWFAERKINPDCFPKNYFKGILNGMWFSIVTFSTVGYGDLVVKSHFGRVLSGFWIVCSMIIASSLTATIATAFTLNQLKNTAIEKASDLINKKVATVEKTTSADVASKYTEKIVKETSVARCIDKLVNKEVDAVVFGAPQLQYYLYKNPNDKLMIIAIEDEVENLSFVVPHKYEHTSLLNTTLLKKIEDGSINKFFEEYGVAR
jgi:polar amino acid transport system substrate-binding protein